MWICNENGFSGQRAVQIDLWNLVLFGNRVSKNGHVSTVEKIEDAIIDMSSFCTEFVDPILENVCGRSSKFVSQLF